jgi:hypothetical protein
MKKRPIDLTFYLLFALVFWAVFWNLPFIY